MPVHSPMGGVIAAIEPDAEARGALSARLEQSGASIVAIPGVSVVLGAWHEFDGQGIWSSGETGCAAAFDLDLSNEDELRELAGWDADRPRDWGALLWDLYRAHDLSFLDRLRGAFAFALWDGDSGRLLAVTDPYGIRPVVWADTGTGMVAASRIRHALHHPRLSRELSPDSIYQYLFFSAIPSPNTIYKQIQKLEPGNFIEIEKSKTRISAYYDIRYSPNETLGESHWRETIPLQVRSAVEKYTRLGDPSRTGCFLSGGTDSSSVAGYAGGAVEHPLETFSIGFDEPGYNELHYAELAARHFKTRQHEYYVTPDDVFQLIAALPRIYDEPFGNSSVIPTFYCARLAREFNLQVMLAGDGGDEIFGGNERYVGNLVFERYYSLPAVLRRGVLEPVLRCLPGVGIVHKAKRYVRRANIPNPDRFYSYNLLAELPLHRVFQPAFLDDLDPECFLHLAREHYQRAAPAHVTDRLLYLDMKFTITDNDLRKVTQMTEAAGVRVRYPLLDRDLVDFTTTIPPTLKVKPGRERYIFKQAMRGFLPDEIITKTKHGFGLPIGPWLKKDPKLKDLLHDTLFAGTTRIGEWLQPPFVADLKAHFDAGEESYYGTSLWLLLVLELWLQENR